MFCSYLPSLCWIKLLVSISELISLRRAFTYVLNAPPLNTNPEAIPTIPTNVNRVYILNKCNFHSQIPRPDLPSPTSCNLLQADANSLCCIAPNNKVCFPSNPLYSKSSSRKTSSSLLNSGFPSLRRWKDA